MLERLQELDLANRSHREAVALTLHADLFEGHPVACVDVARLVDLAVGATSDDRLIARLAVIYAL